MYKILAAVLALRLGRVVGPNWGDCYYSKQDMGLGIILLYTMNEAKTKWLQSLLVRRFLSGRWRSWPNMVTIIVVRGETGALMFMGGFLETYFS